MNTNRYIRERVRVHTRADIHVYKDALAVDILLLLLLLSFGGFFFFLARVALSRLKKKKQIESPDSRAVHITLPRRRGPRSGRIHTAVSRN